MASTTTTQNIYGVFKNEDLRRKILADKSEILKSEEMVERQKHNYKLVVKSLMCLHNRLNIEFEESYNNFTYGEKDEEA